MEKFPEKYPDQTAVGKRFGVSQGTVSRLILHHEALEAFKPSLPRDIMLRGIKLPEGVTREFVMQI
jgi:hypothetical protein